MNIPYQYQAIIYSASDVTAGIFLMALIASAALQKNRRDEVSELMASAILILAGILLRLFTVTVFITPDNSLYKYGLKGMTLIAPNVVWSAAAVLIASGIVMAALHVLKINSLRVKRAGGRVTERVNGYATGRAGGRVTERLALINLVIIVAGVTIFMLTGSNIVYQLAILVQITAITLFLKIRTGNATSRVFAIATAPAVILVIFTMMTGAIRVSGIGYALIPVVLHLLYLAVVKEDLVQREADLAKSRVQLLSEQISPHYIYNSLQSISSLCDTDPAKAKTAIDKFSAYLRGNLESLTEEDLIPFQRELLYTESYLDLERVAGDRLFDVQYDFAVTDFMIPPLTLQPVVENAVRHGAPAAGAALCLIKIATYERDGNIYIEVTDTPAATAVPLKPAPSGRSGKSKRKSVGLDNVRTRLAIQTGGTLAIDSTADGTKVTIKMEKNSRVDGSGRA